MGDDRVTREQFLERLAEVSHETYLRQKARTIRRPTRLARR